MSEIKSLYFKKTQPVLDSNKLIAKLSLFIGQQEVTSDKDSIFELYHKIVAFLNESDDFTATDREYGEVLAAEYTKALLGNLTSSRGRNPFYQF